MNNLADRPVALVTGGARRIGAQIVRELQAEGYRVAIHYHRSVAAAEALCDELNAQTAGSCLTCQADLLQTDKLPGLTGTVLQEFGGLDLLVNNASTFYPTPLAEVTEADWDDLMGSNLKAPLFLSQAAAPALRESGGSIINIIDIHARRPFANHPVYCAAKAGLGMLTRALARDLAPKIRVNGVAPGAIIWPEAGDEAAQDQQLKQIPLARTGNPADIAGAVLYLAKAPYVTGEIISVDGGRSLDW